MEPEAIPEVTRAEEMLTQLADSEFQRLNLCVCLILPGLLSSLPTDKFAEKTQLCSSLLFIICTALWLLILIMLEIMRFWICIVTSKYFHKHHHEGTYNEK